MCVSLKDWLGQSPTGGRRRRIERVRDVDLIDAAVKVAHHAVAAILRIRIIEERRREGRRGRRGGTRSPTWRRRPCGEATEEEAPRARPRVGERSGHCVAEIRLRLRLCRRLSRDVEIVE